MERLYVIYVQIGRKLKNNLLHCMLYSPPDSCFMDKKGKTQEWPRKRKNHKKQLTFWTIDSVRTIRTIRILFRIMIHESWFIKIHQWENRKTNKLFLFAAQKERMRRTDVVDTVVVILGFFSMTTWTWSPTFEKVVYFVFLITKFWLYSDQSGYFD